MAKRVMEPGADRAYRRSDGSCDLVDVEVAVVPKDDSNALIRVEILERAIEGVAVLDVAGGVMRGRVRSCAIQRVVPSVPTPAKPISAGVGEDASEPRVDALHVAELGEIAPGAGEGVVSRIFGLLGVAKDEAGQAIGLVQARVDKSLECGETRRIGRCRDGPDFLRQPEPLASAAIRYTCTDAQGGSAIQSTPHRAGIQPVARGAYDARRTGRMTDAGSATAAHGP